MQLNEDQLDHIIANDLLTLSKMKELKGIVKYNFSKPNNILIAVQCKKGNISYVTPYLI